jgi:hypothetical protein
MPQKKTQVVSIDPVTDTFITLGCHRETDRLQRMLHVFQVALTLADRDQNSDQLRANLVSLHDHKGKLTAVWRNARLGRLLRTYVDRAWEEEGENLSEHMTQDGVVFYASDGIDAMSRRTA